MNTFQYVWDGDLVNGIHDLSKEGNQVKSEIYKTITMNKNVDKTILKRYLSFVKSFLDFWDDYSIDLESRIKNVEPKPGVRTIDYQYVKMFIYSNYDYAAMVYLLDGLLRGYEKGEYKTSEDIRNYFDHTMSKAFDDQGTSVGELLDAVLDRNFGANVNILVGTKECQYFRSIRNYRKLFDHNAKNLIFASIKKVLETLTEKSIPVKLSLDYRSIQVFVAIINSTIEFMTCTVTAYAARTFIISKYAYPFLNHYSEPADGPKYEATEVDYNSDEGVSLWRDLDNIDVMDHRQIEKFLDVFQEFLKSTGSFNFGSVTPYYSKNFINIGSVEGNRFCSKLAGNALYDLITKDRWKKFDFHTINKGNEESVEEVHTLLKSFLYNDKQGLGGYTSPKQEFLHIIRGETCKETIKDYQELNQDLYVASVQILGNLKVMINNAMEANPKTYNDLIHPSTKKYLSEIISMLTELYREIASAIIQKARFIEMKLNEMHQTSMNKVQNELKLKVPGEKSDLSMNDVMMSTVPDTTRIPTTMIDLYAMPQYEAAKMMNEYYSTIYPFSMDMYFQEGVISNIIDKIMALLEACRKRFHNFVNNQQTKKAVNWVIKNEKDLKALAFNGDDRIDRCFPLKDNIVLPQGFEKLANGLKSFNEQTVATDEALNKFIISLYPNETIYSWFTDDKFKRNGKQMGAQMYRNLILFQEMNQITMDPPKTVTYQGQNLEKKFYNWIDTIKGIQEVQSSYQKLDTDITNGMNRIKSTVASITAKETQEQQKKREEERKNQQQQNQQTTQQNTQTTQNNPNAQPTGNASPTGNQPDTTQVHMGNGKESNDVTPAGRALQSISQVLTNIWIPLGDMICQAIQTEYKYVSMIYKAKKAEQQNQNQ